MAAPRQKIATVNRLMAVLDTAEAVATATSELARAGFGPDAITVLVGNEDADRIDLAVHARRMNDRERAKRALAAAGALFMNFFGRIATEDISRWRGKELPIPPYLRR